MPKKERKKRELTASPEALAPINCRIQNIIV
jgi:hypothetical protein